MTYVLQNLSVQQKNLSFNLIKRAFCLFYIFYLSKKLISFSFPAVIPKPENLECFIAFGKKAKLMRSGLGKGLKKA